MKFQRSHRRWWRHPHSPPPAYVYKVKRRYLVAMDKKFKLLKAAQKNNYHKGVKNV